MTTQLWSIRGSLAEFEQVTKRANEFLDRLAAKGNQYRETHVSTAGEGGRAILLITIVYEGVAAVDPDTA